MGFHPVKTNDIVSHNGQKHIVTGLDITSDGVVVQMRPIENRVKTVFYEDLDLSSDQHNHDGIKRLVARDVSQRAMQKGFDVGRRGEQITRHNRDPFSTGEVVHHVHRLLEQNLKASAKGLIDQEMLDHVVHRISLSQGYLIAANRSSFNNSVKSGFEYAKWQDIARVATQFANTYNKRMLNLL